MALNPLKPCPTAEFFSLLDLFEDLFNQVLVLHGPSDAGNPVVLDPIDMPDGNAINGILGIGINENFAVQWRNIDSTEYRSKFCSLVSLAGSCEGLRNVSRA